MIPLPVLYHHLWRIPFLRFNAQAFCWLSSGEENRTSLFCLYFPALFCLTHTPYHPRVSWLISAENEMLLQLQWSSMFQALLVDALFFSPSGNFKNQASIVAYVHLHKIDMLEYPKIPQRLDDHIPASTDAFASSTEGSTGLASQSVGQPWRAKWAY